MRSAHTEADSSSVGMAWSPPLSDHDLVEAMRSRHRLRRATRSLPKWTSRPSFRPAALNWEAGPGPVPGLADRCSMGTRISRKHHSRIGNITGKPCHITGGSKCGDRCSGKTTARSPISLKSGARSCSRPGGPWMAHYVLSCEIAGEIRCSFLRRRRFEGSSPVLGRS